LALAGLIALLATTTSPVSAQVTAGKVTGVVTDAQTGEPLAGVQVYLEGTGRGALTAENGRYFIVNVQAGVYTLVAELLGYQTVRVENVLISVDRTHQINFQLTPQAIAVEEIRVEVERAPLIRVDATGTRQTTTSAQLEALPVTSIEEALSLQQGFLEVPQNENIIAFNDTRRGLTPIRIRGGRSGETLTLIDGIPVNNFVFGGPALSLTRKAVDQIDFIRGGFPPEYGNALSGIINIVTKEGGTELRGAFEYQTTEIAGALGSVPDDLENFDFFEGYVSGPIPGTEFGMASPRLRFTLAGRQVAGANRVLEFDDDVFDPSVRTRAPINRANPTSWDLFPGWRAFGYDQTRDIFGKLTVFVAPTAKLNLTALVYERQQQPFDFEFLRAQSNPFDSPLIDTQADSLFAFGANANNFDIAQASAQLDRTLLVASWEQTLARTAYSVRVGVFNQKRTTCNFFGGICLRDAFDDPNFDNNRFVRGGVTDQTPALATDEFGFGGEDVTTVVGRFDIESQVTEHHQLQTGVYYEKHDLDFEKVSDFGVNEVIPVQQNYFAKPFNAAVYLQDRIEYDFISVDLGFRFDWGKAGGLFFADPLDPTNGTNAVDVCRNPGAFGPVEDPRTGDLIAPNSNWTVSTCSGATRDSAAVVAFGDDLTESQTRTQFSPRLGVTFPVTANSNVFFNFSRLSQNPLFNNIYQNTSIGTEGEAIPCGFVEPGKEQVNGCGPIIAARSFSNTFLGNPNLLIESTTMYEIGYLAEVFDDYALQMILFNKDQFGLTGLREVIGISDPGATYGSSTPQYLVLVNQDFQTVRGVEVALRRRVTSYWGFDLNYSWSQARTNAAPPEREFQNQQNNALPRVNREVVSDIDVPHRFNGALFFAAGAEPPEIRLGGLNLGEVLRNSRLTVTIQAQSGFPFTPVRGFTEGENINTRLLRNTERGPGIWMVDFRADKSFRIGNVLYGAFVRVDNVFDTKNCIQVFPSTGTCDSGTIDQSRARQGNSVTPDQVNSTFFDRPHQFGPRRRISAGFRMNF
jgi:hypothetical protein